ncbi:MAG: Ig-like domain-containing protein [Clostridia bacterium]
MPLLIGAAAVGVVLIIAALFLLLRPGAESIEITSKTTSLVDGEVCDLDYKAEPAFSKADVIWSTSDEDVATIDSKGVLTAITAGHVIVTAQTDNGVSDTYEIDIVSDCVTEYQGVDYAPVYDFNYYIAANPDVRKNYKDDPEGALQYYVEHGMAEGQRAISGFDVMGYAKAYSDVRTAYGYDIYGITCHYLESGRNEGRSGVGSETMLDYVTEYNGIDYSAVYDYNYFVDLYPQVYSTYGINDQKTLEYFVTKCMKDGCQGSSEFNPISYANEYPEARKRCNVSEDDVDNLFEYYQEAGGFDYSAYYYDYMEIGKNEGCHGTGCSRMIGFAVKYDGEDYSSVYDYNDYVSEYSDIFNLFGVDDYAVLKHFALYGQEEGRTGKK